MLINNLNAMTKVASNIFCSIIIILLLVSCVNFNKGLPGASNSIEMSKGNGVFICEYKSLQNPLVIDTLINCSFNSIWLEKRWRYGENGEAIPFRSDRGDFQLIIETNETCKSNYEDRWYVAYDKYNNLRVAGKNSFIIDTQYYPDTILLPVLVGDFFKSNADYNNKIYDIELVKIKQ